MGMKQGREYRAVQDFSLVPRAEEKDEYRVRGTAVVFDTPTVLFEYDGVKYSEVIDRNAFDECDMSDVIFNYNHGGKVVARLRNKTLTLTIDERGLHMEADLGGTQAGRELYEEIDGGYVDKMSFSFSVRESKYDSVYQCVEDNNIAWHCGTSGAYVHPRCRNENSIGIEVRPYKLDKSTARSAAPADWYFPPEIVDNLVVFTQMLMQKYNVPLENVVRHYDVTGKWCPRPWMGDDTNTYYGTSGNEQWKKFKERLSGEELDMNIEEARKQLTSCADTGDTPSAWARDAAEFCKRKGIFNGDGAGNYGWQQPITREAVAQILYNAFESAGMLDAIPDKK